MEKRKINYLEKEEEEKGGEGGGRREEEGRRRRRRRRRRNGWTKETIAGITAAPPLQSVCPTFSRTPACMQVLV